MVFVWRYAVVVVEACQTLRRRTLASNAASIIS